MFYIFIDADAMYISEYTNLKLANHTKDIYKCGFPENSLDKYLKILNKMNIKIEIINLKEENICNNNLYKYLNKIKKMNLYNISPLDSLEILITLQGLLK